MTTRAQRRTPEARARSAQINAIDPQLEKRARYSQLNFQATVAALRDGCDCVCCQKTRELADLLAGEPPVEISPNGQRDGP